MANAGAGFGRLIVEQAPKLIVKHGPTLMKVVNDLRTFLQEHPAIPTWVQARFADIARQVDEIRKKRGDAAQIRGMVDLVREQATSSDLSGDVDEWVRRADNIALRVGFAERLSPPLQKQKLAELKVETETLLAAFIDALAYVPPATPSE